MDIGRRLPDARDGMASLASPPSTAQAPFSLSFQVASLSSSPLLCSPVLPRSPKRKGKVPFLFPFPSEDPSPLFPPNMDGSVSSSNPTLLLPPPCRYSLSISAGAINVQYRRWKWRGRHARTAALPSGGGGGEGGREIM